MQEQLFGMNQGCVRPAGVGPAMTRTNGAVQKQNNICQGDSDADFALVLLNVVMDVIRENADKFIVRPPLFSPLTAVPPPPSQAQDDDLDDYMDEFDDLVAPSPQPAQNRPNLGCNDVPAQEIEWKPEYGSRSAFYSTRELARLTGRSISRVRRWVKEGKIAAVRFGGVAPNGQIFIAKDQLARLKALGIGQVS